MIHFLGNLIAIILQEPRPFWYSSKINSELCTEGYGNPSQSTIISASILPILFIELFHKNRFRYFAYTILIFIIITISFSGLYLGDNFIHQVIASLFYSFVIVTFYFTFSNQLSDLCLKSCSNYYKNRIFMMYWAILIFMLITLVFIIEGIVNVIPYNHSEMVSNAGLHCNSNFKPNGTYNRNSSLEILYALGFVYGCLGVSKHLSIY